MTRRLDIDAGETHTVEAGATEEWLGANVDGTLDVEGTLKLVDDADAPVPAGEGPGISPLDLPTGGVSFDEMATDTAIFFIGFMGLLGAAGVVLQNYISVALVALSMIALILAGTMNMGIEVFYGFLVAAAIMLAAGVVVRWSSV